MNLNESKAWLRKYCLNQRKKISAAERSKKSRRICRTIIQSREFKKAKVIASFISYGSEVQTEEIMQAAWRQGKTVLIPVSAHGFHKPYFVEYKKSDEIRKMPHGPFELVEIRKPFDFKKIDVMLVPGLGFDQHNHRLGFGGGVYDRIIQKTPRTYHVGLFFDEQGLKTLPRAQHDRSLVTIVSA